VTIEKNFDVSMIAAMALKVGELQGQLLRLDGLGEKLAKIAEVTGKQAGVTGVEVVQVWDPPWNPAMASEAVRAHFGWS